MAVTFVSIQSTKSSKYEVIKMSFPTRKDAETVTLLISKKSIETKKDKETAEAAAKKFAELNKFSYVPENTSVITVIPFGESGFLAMELQPNGGVIGRGSVVERSASIAQATKVATSRSLPLVLSKTGDFFVNSLPKAPGGPEEIAEQKPVTTEEIEN